VVTFHNLKSSNGGLTTSNFENGGDVIDCEGIGSGTLKNYGTSGTLEPTGRELEAEGFKNVIT
jgi:hypothetical protein